MNSKLESIKQKFTAIPKDQKRFIGAALVLVIASVVGLSLLPKDTRNDQSPTALDSQNSNRSEFPEYLNPTSEIKVGDQRYVSACRVLDLGTVKSIYGDLNDKDFISEEYIDVSVGNDTLPYEFSCTYGELLKLDTSQFSDPNKVKNLTRSIPSVGASNMDKKVSDFEKAANSSNDQSIKEFVTKLKSGAALYNQQRSSGRAFAGEADSQLKLDGMVFPSTQSAYGFSVAQNNVMYTVTIDKESYTESIGASEEVMRENLMKMMKASSAIVKNASNTSLTQAPAPTTIGSNDKNQDTKVLESCAIFNAAVFKNATGKDQNGIIDRVTVPVKFVKESTKSGSKQALPRNSCQRSYGQDGAQSTSTQNMRLDLNIGESEAAVTKVIEDGYKLDADDAMLQTSADWAAELKVSNQVLYVFRTGSYIGIVDIDADTKDTTASRDVHIKAINDIVANIKSAL